jgi:hypothetical protein
MAELALGDTAGPGGAADPQETQLDPEAQLTPRGTVGARRKKWPVNSRRLSWPGGHRGGVAPQRWS